MTTPSESGDVLRRILWLTFVESFGTILLERGLYFYTNDILHFSDTQNLWLALAFGVTYVAAAAGSHRAAVRFGERRVLLTSLWLLLGLHLALMLIQSPVALVAAFPLVGALQGLKWPIVESFVSAGRGPSELVRVLGRFNTSWAIAVPLALASSGTLIASAFPGALFAAAAGLNALALALGWPLPAQPLHLEETHPERPPAGELSRAASLLVSARWTMLLSYALLFLLAPLVPNVFAKLGLDVALAAPASGLLDLARVAAFAFLGVVVGWRGRAQPLALALATLPVSFAMILFGNSLAIVLLGEVLFGFASGLCYTAALYYALLVKNASVDAGGAHEALIGLGFALGPLAGLIGRAAAPALGGYVVAMLVTLLPLFGVCTFGALRPLRLTR